MLIVSNKTPYNWKCPYCNTKTTIIETNRSLSEHDVSIPNEEGAMLLTTEWIVCPNNACLKTTLEAKVFKLVKSQFGWGILPNTILDKTLLPKTICKQLPDYIPLSLKLDYEEASAIQYLSPKASATLSRRCLQGMIRDFWGISKSRLIDEISAIESRIDPITWKAIDAVRKVGNIGAHMEKDISLVIEVDPQEARLLLDLIELLFEEWYIHRYERELKINNLISMVETKAKPINKN